MAHACFAVDRLNDHDFYLDCPNAGSTVLDCPEWEPWVPIGWRLFFRRLLRLAQGFCILPGTGETPPASNPLGKNQEETLCALTKRRRPFGVAGRLGLRRARNHEGWPKHPCKTLV